MNGFGRVFIAVLAVLLAFSLALADDDHHEEHSPDPEPHHEHETHHHGSNEGNLDGYQADVSYTLKTVLAESGFAYAGVGGEIDGVVNPILHAHHGDIVEIVLMNGDGVEHDLHFPAFEAMSEHVAVADEISVFAFQVDEDGRFEYFCVVPGHREAGMVGVLEVGEEHH